MANVKKNLITFKDTETGARRTLDPRSKRDQNLIKKMRSLKSIIRDPENPSKLIEGGIRWVQVEGAKAAKPKKPPKAPEAPQEPEEDLIGEDDLQED